MRSAGVFAASTLMTAVSVLSLGLLDLGGDVLGLLFALDDRDAHVGEHRIDVFDLVGGDFLRGHEPN